MPAEHMRTIFATQLAPVAMPGCRTPAEAALRAGLAASQILGMALCRYVLCLPPIVALSREEVIEWIAPTLQRYLTG
ncbi:hypothetical protein [Microtetraspora sp. NBRC 16547]|uniref:TetR/AcrR family transcriptional regulator n=1 Tax=Microtetraspora sp. NBRC 16547 TaxID=3030993 RepID=UPI0025523B05|nr:hypothetical protein [Microtetraspora sp. NBRC 16547]